MCTLSLNDRGDDLDLGCQRESSSGCGDDLDLGYIRKSSSDSRGDLDLSHQIFEAGFLVKIDTPQCIYGENGSNFTGGERELCEGLPNINQKKVNDYLIQKEVKWHYGPPIASHMGGVWERIVKSVKTILKVRLKGQVVEDEVVATLMTEVEAILNSRPITQISQDS